MNFGSSVLHIVVEPATDCCRYVGVEDTIEQLLMVRIVECSCQIKRNKHCSVKRQQCRRSPPTLQCMSSVSTECHVEQGGKGSVSVFWAAGALPAFWPLGTVD